VDAAANTLAAAILTAVLEAVVMEVLNNPEPPPPPAAGAELVQVVPFDVSTLAAVPGATDRGQMNHYPIERCLG